MRRPASRSHSPPHHLPSNQRPSECICITARLNVTLSTQFGFDRWFVCVFSCAHHTHVIFDNNQIMNEFGKIQIILCLIFSPHFLHRIRSMCATKALVSHGIYRSIDARPRSRSNRPAAMGFEILSLSLQKIITRVYQLL